MTITFFNGNNITISDFDAFSFVIQEVIKLHDKQILLTKNDNTKV